MILLRHTRPEGAEGLCYGRLDLGLDAGFEDEVSRLAAELPEFSAVVSSPLSRCLMLAQRLGAARGVGVSVAAELIEMDFGAWEGIPWDAVPRGELDAWAADFLEAAPHGGESVRVLADRVALGMAAVPDGALVVTHAGVIKAVLAARGVDGAWEARPAFGEFLQLG